MDGKALTVTISEDERAVIADLVMGRARLLDALISDTEADGEPVPTRLREERTTLTRIRHALYGTAAKGGA